MTTNNPITIDAKTYDRFVAQLAISTRFQDGRHTGSASVTLTWCRVDENGNTEYCPAIDREYQLPDETTEIRKLKPVVTVLIGDTEASMNADPSSAAAIGAIAQVLQNYIDAKGL